MSAQIAIIAGTGFARLLTDAEPIGSVATPYGDASCVPRRGLLHGADVTLLARHGDPHRLAPHRVNYRANLWLLRALGAETLIATNTVGGIGDGFDTGVLAVPNQIIDYTWGREHTFMDGDRLEHAEFGAPYDGVVRSALLDAGGTAGIQLIDGGTYGCTQGPRLESAAEIERMARDGCDLVGMTAMPEAGLARELGIAYGAICLVVNRAAGRGEPITEGAMAAVARQAVPIIGRLLGATVAALGSVV